MHCMICGIKDGEEREKGEHVAVHEYKLPHGKIHLCTSRKCKEHFYIHLDSGVPIVWVSRDDLYEEDWRSEITKEEDEDLTADDLREIAVQTQRIFCDDTYNEGFNQSIAGAVDLWREEKERTLVQDSPLKELPLLIGTLKYDRNTQILEQRLKGK